MNQTTRKPTPGMVAVALLVLLGTCVLLYPSAASWYSAVLISRQSDSYQRAVEQMQPADRSADLRAAHQYNRRLATAPTVTDPFDATAELTVRTDDPYWSMLDPASDGVMGLIRIPAIDAELPIYHGTAEDVLAKGVGHLPESALPVGGRGTHAVLTGHRGVAEATLFTDLDRLRVSDDIEISVLGQTLRYAVTDVRTVLPTDTRSLLPVPGEDLITLVTCTPIGVNSHRILVTAERTQAPASPEESVTVSPVGFPWWAAVLGVVTIGLGVYLFRRRRSRVDRAEGSGPPAGGDVSADAGMERVAQ